METAPICRPTTRCPGGIALVLAVVVGLSASPGEAAPAVDAKAAEVIGKVRERYAGLKAFRAEFQQTFHWKVMGSEQEIPGLLTVQKPARFRLETPEQTIVSDGVNVWSYTPANQQVILSALEASDDYPTPDRLIESYLRDYAPSTLRDEKLEGKRHHVLLLAPVSERTRFTSVVIWVHAKKHWLSRVEGTDVMGNVTVFTLSKPQINPKLKDEVFQFAPPEGTEVVDLR